MQISTTHSSGIPFPRLLAAALLLTGAAPIAAAVATSDGWDLTAILLTAGFVVLMSCLLLTSLYGAYLLYRDAQGERPL